MFVRIAQDIKNVEVKSSVLVRNVPKRNGRKEQSLVITSARKNLKKYKTIEQNIALKKELEIVLSKEIKENDKRKNGACFLGGR